MKSKEYSKQLRDHAEWSRAEAEKYERAAKWAEENGDNLEPFTTRLAAWWVEIDTPTREVLLQVLKTFPGRWTKSVPRDNGTIQYDLITESGVVLQCMSAPPPPSCKIVEKWVDVPAQPATRKLIKTIECTPAKDEALIMAGGVEETPEPVETPV